MHMFLQIGCCALSLCPSCPLVCLCFVTCTIPLHPLPTPDQDHDGYLTYEELVNAVGDYRDRRTVKKAKGFPM
jgi:hypothetical protein